jgi:CheY-like chemotaxis protein
MASILVIDGYDGFRETMAYCLPKFGHDVVCVADAGAAIRAAKKQPMQLVLLDVGRPGFRGLADCALLLRSAMLAKTPVVVMTGYPSAEIAEGALAAAAVAVLAKPFQWPELLAVIARWAPAAGGG